MALWNGFALFQALRWAILSYRPALVDDAWSIKRMVHGGQTIRG